MSNAIAHSPERPPGAPLTRAQKAAVILCLLDRDGATPVFEKLDEEAIRRFVGVMTQLNHVDGATVRAVVAEFLTELGRNQQSVRGGASAAMAMIGNYLGDAAAARFSEGLDLHSEKDIWKRMSQLNPRVLAEFIAHEHPQAAAVILSKLPPERAGKVINELAPEQVQRILLVFRRMKTLDARSVEMIGESLGNSLLAARAGASTLTPAERAGSILNYAAAELRDNVLSQLRDRDPDFSEAVKRKMFTFEDIEARVARNDVSVIVRAVDSAVLVKALAGAAVTAPGARDYILSCISARMAEVIAGEVAEAGEVNRRDADEAQAEIVQTIRDLEAAGEITLIRPDGN